MPTLHPDSQRGARLTARHDKAKVQRSEVDVVTHDLDLTRRPGTIVHSRALADNAVYTTDVEDWGGYPRHHSG